METLTKFNEQLVGAPVGVLIFLGVIVCGYVLRVLACFPNRFIPAAVILLSAIFFMLLAPRGELALRIWLGRNFLIGITIGFVAWKTHRNGLSKIEDKIPFLKGWLEDDLEK